LTAMSEGDSPQTTSDLPLDRSAAPATAPRPESPPLSAAQLATLRAVGEERVAEDGEVLYQVGDRSYSFIAIVEGEVAIRDAAGEELVRHRSSGFVGELNLLTGETLYVTAVATRPTRYIAVDRDELRSLLFDDASLADLVLSSFL